ncbi:uncharacterized protein LOC114789075 [Denticeps clupeoides]|uniref:uncharacterized protein LOC114789075 n=1 Tax=Denticeps clupeoides TaxID=299321 RepID=UPI0010A2FD36|nr:uncharacterized protein LOC114789075 [Denticeps clupeoides]
MNCYLGFLFQICLALAYGGGSGSVEAGPATAAMMKAGVMKGGMAAKTGMVNGLVIDGQLSRLLPAGTLLVQQPGNPVDQGGMAVVPAGALQPGMTVVFAVPPEQQGQPQIPQTVDRTMSVLAVLPQNNQMGMQQLQLVSIPGPNNLQPGMGTGQTAGAAARVRVKHSAPAMLGANAMPTTTMLPKMQGNPTMSPMSLADIMKLSVVPQKDKQTYEDCTEDNSGGQSTAVPELVETTGKEKMTTVQKPI